MASVEVGHTAEHAGWVPRDHVSVGRFMVMADRHLTGLADVRADLGVDVLRVLDVFMANAVAHGVGHRMWASVSLHRNPREFVLWASVRNDCAVPISTPDLAHHNRGVGTLLARRGAGLALVEVLAPVWGAMHCTAADQRAQDIRMHGPNWADYAETLFPRTDITCVHASWRWLAGQRVGRDPYARSAPSVG
jgi:hypothetical protein